MITAKSYFSGAGGMDLGLVQAGINITHSYEIDSTCCNTLRTNFTHEIHQEDISKITVLDQQDADIYVGTFPCTRYSAIADIHGTRTGDDLFLHFFRHVALARPEMYIVENVPGMKKFRVVMEALTRLPDYYVRIECPINANMWLPQKRKRLILIGTKRPFDNLKYPESNPIKLKNLLEDDPEIDIPNYVYKRLNGAYRDKPIISTPEGVAPTCVAHYSKDLSTRLINDGKRVRPYTPKEYARLQGFPDSFKFPGSNRDIYKQVGNAVAVPMGKWVGEQVIRYFN
ncbi:DNA cytosine methyltransferase [Clostridium botulinum]|uniref:DNA (cytosine-5-)-methyltransferase n=1 Tax=Clostridium botulinum TaxID=1491 RepID=A0A6M0SYQ2_CLOBO|nr:DNA cytosine methyltransferase [Clostridium botulinum]NFI74458.1 DNA cytosine methyltransferase [Clostridium sporogenes]NFP62366.1 DNA cytosine methyltransferase [Clostridium sporogenes]NFU95482.1 DNA cytosine methyltransferase [Clostridium sporogenes]NFV68198.1 DNA cytosine methyltransferase [Clostridium botulinum]